MPPPPPPASSPTVAVFSNTACLLHDPGDHPESPERLRALLAAVADHPEIALHQAPPGDLAALSGVHASGYLDHLARYSAGGGGALTPDTVMNGATWDAILGAAGAATVAVEHALGGGHAFAAVRPPGHHAGAAQAMGFCFVNNVVVAARWAMARGVARVLMVDWDVHHGNGTQSLVEHDPAIRFVSLHRWPWYPGTGAESERGVGNVVNVPRPPGLPAATYVADLWAGVELALSGWAPDLVLISAGFDAMLGDPLGGFTLEPTDYADLTTRLRTALPDVPIVGLLEGGYIPERLAAGAMAHVRALG